MCHYSKMTLKVFTFKIFFDFFSFTTKSAKQTLINKFSSWLLLFKSRINAVLLLCAVPTTGGREGEIFLKDRRVSIPITWKFLFFFLNFIIVTIQLITVERDFSDMLKTDIHPPYVISTNLSCSDKSCINISVLPTAAYTFKEKLAEAHDCHELHTGCIL